MDWNGRRVAVTGADGFIGSHLVDRLRLEGAAVRALCLYNSNGSRGWLDETGVDSVDARLGDIRDAEFVRDFVSDVEVVFHLAALIAIPYSYEAPRSFVETNVTGTLNVLEAVRHHRTPLVIHTSTSEVYGTPQTTPITEAHPIVAQSPYAASKVAADQLAHAYACSFETNVRILRPFNTFGPRQSMRAVIPTVLAQMIAGARSVRIGSLHPKRDFTFVADTVDGFLALATAPGVSPGDVVQLGTGVAVSIGDLFDLCAAVTGSTARPEVDAERVRPEASEVQVLLSDPSAADSKLGWRPRTALRDGLEATADWIGRHRFADVERYRR